MNGSQFFTPVLIYTFLVTCAVFGFAFVKLKLAPGNFLSASVNIPEIVSYAYIVPCKYNFANFD